MMSFPEMLTVLATQSKHPRFNEVNSTLIQLKLEDPSQLLLMCVNTLNDEDIDLKIKLHAVAFITTLVKIEANNKNIKVTGPSLETFGTELLESFFNALMAMIYSGNEGLSIASSNTLAHFKIYEFLSFNDTDRPHPALEFADMITPEAPVSVCDCAMIMIHYTFKIIKNIKRNAMEHILEIIIGRLLEGETSDNFKLLFVEISALRLDLISGRMEDGDIGIGQQVLSAIDTLTEYIPQDVIWFWSQVAQKSYELLRLAADLPSRIFEILDTVNDEFLEKAKIEVLQFWNAVSTVEYHAIKNNFQFVVCNLEQILNFIIQCVISDTHTDPIYISEVTLGSSAVESILKVVKLGFEESYNVLQPFISENIDSEDIQVKTAVAISLRALLTNTNSPESLAAMAEFSEDVINTLLQDESPRVLNMGISCLSSAISSNVIDLTEEIVGIVGELALSGIDHVMENAILTLAQIGKSENEGAAEAAVDALFTVAEQNHNEAISSNAIHNINAVVGHLSQEAMGEVFEKAMEISTSLLETAPESISLGEAVVVMNTVLNHLKHESEPLVESFLQLCSQLLDTPSAAPAINGFGIVVFFFGKENPEIIEAAHNVVLAKINYKEEPEAMRAAMRLASFVVVATQDAEVHNSILEATIPLLMEEGVDSELLPIELNIIEFLLTTGNFFDEIRPHTAAILGACKKIFQTGTNNVESMKVVYEVVVSLGHVVESGSEDEEALLNAAVTFLRMMGSHPKLSASYPDVLIDTMYLVFSRSEELFIPVRKSRFFRYIVSNAMNSTDEITKKRIEEMKAYQP